MSWHTFFWKGQKAAYGPYILHLNYNYLILLYHESSHRKYRSERANPNKVLFAKVGSAACITMAYSKGS